MTTGDVAAGGPHEKAYFPQLTGVRAAAAYSVYLYHFNPFPRDLANGAFYWFGAELHVGVTFFYVLSGFLIYYNYGQKIKRLSLPFLRQYARNRFARIYPVYFVVLISTYLLNHWPPPHLLLIHLTLTQALFPPYMMTGIPQAWTLTVEETFYFSAPWIFLMTRKWTLAAPVASLLALGVVLSVLTGTPSFIFGRTLCGAIIAFAAGIVVAMQTLKHHHRLGTPRRGPVTGLSLLACVILVAIMSRISWHETIGVVENPMNSVILIVVLPVFIASFYWGLLMEESWTRRILSNRLSVLLGASSYAFYLIHQGALQAFLDHALNLGNLGRFLLLNVISVLLYEGFERPVNLWLKGRPEDTSHVRPRLLNRWTSCLAVAILLPFVIDLGFWTTTNRAPLSSMVASCRGNIDLANNQTLLAMIDYQRAVELDPANRVAREQLGSWHLLEGRPADALAHWREIVSRAPNEVKPRVRLGISQLRAGQLEPAIRTLESVLKEDPRNAEAHNFFGIAMLQSQRFDTALAHFTVAVKLEPGSSQHLVNRGVALVRLGRLHEARKQFELALAANPNDADAKNNLHQIEVLLQGR